MAGVSPLEFHFQRGGVELLPLGEASVPRHFGDPIAEHRATREACGLFDFSFMGLWEIGGPGAAAHVARLQTRDLSAFEPGRVAYTLLLRPDGSVFIDATVWVHAPDRFWVFTGRRADDAWVRADAARFGSRVQALHGSQAVLAMQGPRSGEWLARVAGADAVRALRYFRFAPMRVGGEAAVVGRLGFSGELGYEVLVAADRAPETWSLLLEAGRPFGAQACGFIATDSLRIECASILFSHELAKPRLPAELGMRHFVTAPEGTPCGAAAARRPGESRLVCVEIDDVPALPAMTMMQITSESLSPTYGCRLGLGFAPTAASGPGAWLRDARGRRLRVLAGSRHDPARLRVKAEPLPPA